MPRNNENLAQARWRLRGAQVGNVPAEKRDEKLFVVNSSIAFLGTVTVGDDEIFLVRKQITEAKLGHVKCRAEPARRN